MCAGPVWHARTSCRSSVAYSGTIARSAGGPSIAAWSVANPAYELPNIPTEPVHQGCSASQAMTAHRSSASVAGYSSTATPSEVPVPRVSTRQTA